jgi:hypothetical protein
MVHFFFTFGTFFPIWYVVPSKIWQPWSEWGETKSTLSCAGSDIPVSVGNRGNKKVDNVIIKVDVLEVGISTQHLDFGQPAFT